MNESSMTIHRLIFFTSLLATGFLAHPEESDMAWRYQVSQDAVTLMVNPLSTSSRTAFYEGRGFAAEMIRPYAQACGFSFGMRNDSPVTIGTRLTEWHAIGADGQQVALRPPEAWDAAWEQAGVPQTARLAFHWAQFQTANSFEPGDWIMGMAVLESPPGPPFRLVARYHDTHGDHEIVIDELTCSPH